MLEKINNFISVFIDGLKSLFYYRLWTPFVLLAILSFFVAYMIYNPFASFWSGLILAIGKSKFFGGGSAFAHYPNHLLIAPSIYSRVSILPAIIVESLISAGAFVIFAGFYSGQKVGFFAAVKKAFSRYHFLILSSIIIYGLLLFVSWIIPGFFEEFLKGSPRRLIIFSIAMRFLLFFVLSPFIYVVPYIVLQDENIVSAFGKSIKTWFKNFFTTFFVVAITQGITLPFFIALDFSIDVSEMFNPGILSYILYAGIISVMIASFLFTSMVTRFFAEYHE
jgi:hypothetical protein